MDHTGVVILEDQNVEQSWNATQLGARVLEPRLVFWGYAAAGLVLGCSQQKLHQELGQAAGAVVRASGGGAVLTGPWLLSASLVLPNGHALATASLLESYRWFGLAHARALRKLGIGAEAVPPEDLPLGGVRSDLSWACYGSMSPWEVAVAGRKIIGLAQARRRNGVLLTSGTLIRMPDWNLLCKYLRKPTEDAKVLTGVTTSCAAELGQPELPSDLVFAALHEELSAALCSKP